MGEIAKAQARGRGPMGSQAYGAKPTRFVLPIFKEPTFIGHKTMNPNFVAGHKKGSFSGEDAYGWGLHQTGVIDCVNLAPSICKNGFNLKVNQNWQELLKEYRSGETMEEFLKRITIQVRMDPNSIKRIPDPEIWNVEVMSSSGDDIQQTASGKLVLKSRPTEGLEKQRGDMYAARSTNINFDDGSDTPWVMNP